MNIVALLSFVAIVVAYEDVPDAYFNTMANDLDEFRAYVTCVLGKGPCNEFAKHAKNHVTEILKDDCRECDDVQKHFTHILINDLKTKLPELYDEFEAKFDPKRKLLDAVDKNVEKY